MLVMEMKVTWMKLEWWEVELGRRCFAQRCLWRRMTDAQWGLKYAAWMVIGLEKAGRMWLDQTSDDTNSLTVIKLRFSRQHLGADRCETIDLSYWTHTEALFQSLNFFTLSWVTRVSVLLLKYRMSALLPPLLFGSSRNENRKTYIDKKCSGFMNFTFNRSHKEAQHNSQLLLSGMEDWRQQVML